MEGRRNVESRITQIQDPYLIRTHWNISEKHFDIRYMTHFIYFNNLSSSVEYICWHFILFDLIWYLLISFVCILIYLSFDLLHLSVYCYLSSLSCLHSYIISRQRHNETSALNYMLHDTMYSDIQTNRQVNRWFQFTNWIVINILWSRS